MAKTVVGIFDDVDNARLALEELHDEGFARADISLIAGDADRRFSSLVGEEDGRVEPGDSTVEGMGAGAVIGGIAGLVVGLAATAIPGIGPIVAAGPLASLIVGAEIGGVTGGIIGALTYLDVPERRAHFYAEQVRRGATLLVLRTDDGMAPRADAIMRDNGADNVDGRAEHQHPEPAQTTTDRDDESNSYIAASAAVGAVGAANYSAITGAPGAPGAVVAAMAATTAGRDDGDGEFENPEYNVIDRRSKDIDAEKHDLDEDELERRI